jgi:beta-RFAP synthase
MAADGEVFVEAWARLHLGVLDLRRGSGRWFGGIGASAPAPTLLVSASRAGALSVAGADEARTAEYARRALAHFGIRGGVRISVHRALPSHSGLGSGTQLALAVARAVAEVHGIEADAPALARAVGRARRSAVGTWTFADGGLVLEGGHLQYRDGCPPLLARLPFPPSWRCVVAVPDGRPGVSGADEETAFDQLPEPPDREVEHVAHLVLMALLPALAEGDITEFGAALTRVQEITGRWFSLAQGGAFAAGPSTALVRQMQAWGAAGVGQSSWGPAVYGIVEGEQAGARLTDLVRGAAGPACQVYEGPFPPHGARVSRRRSPDRT